MSTQTNVDEQIKIEITPPRMWKVVFLNDDKTPMEFVIDLLTGIFKHSEMAAKDITLEIHNTGSGIAGVYNYEIAEHKAVEAVNISKASGFPLRIQVEEE